MKYPIGIQDFESIIQGGYVYVDKTELVYRMTHEGKTYFLSRPRRFGKSLLVSTLKYYYLGRKDLFTGLAIDGMETEWAKHPVFHIDFNGANFMQDGALAAKIDGVISGWERIYGKNPDSNERRDRFSYVLRQAHEQTGRRAVVLIDEYDKPILDVLDTQAYGIANGEKSPLENIHRDILKGFYSVFKLADQDLQFVLLTGVTKFSQVSVFSGFNQPNDISMVKAYETFCGITNEELDCYFSDSMCQLAEEYSCTLNEMKQRLKKQYDGYHFSTRMTDIYNPFSLLNCFANLQIESYWFRSGTPTYLVRLLSHTREDMDEMVGRYYRTSEFIDYKANVEKPLPMIYQSGYLTVKDCNPATQMFLLDFPNDEVREGFLTAVANDYFKPSTGSVDAWIAYAVDYLQRGEIDAFMKKLTSFLASIPYSMRRKSDERERERYFYYTFYLLLRVLTNFTVHTEREQSQGRVDCIVETSDYIYVFEFKLDGSAEEALRQIEEKGYARPYDDDPRRLYRIGANFSSEEGTIEKYLIEG